MLCILHPSKASVPTYTVYIQGELPNLLVQNLKHMPASGISNIKGSRMGQLCYIYKVFYHLLYRAGNFQTKHFRVNRVQTGPIRQPVCLPIGDSLLTTGRMACAERHSNRSCSKKGGETFVVVSPRNAKVHRQSGDVQRGQIVSQSCLSCAAWKEKQPGVTGQERITNKCLCRYQRRGT